MIDDIPLPNQLVGGRPVVASVVYSDVPLDGITPRFEVLLLRLMAEPPYFEVGTWDMLTPSPTPIGDQKRYRNIVFAVRAYESMGGDV